MTAPLLDGADYAVVPIMAQVEYPADGSSTDIILPDGVTVLDFYGAPAADADTLLHSSYYETSAAVMGLYVQAADDFSAQLVYTDPNGDMQTKTLNVTIDREHTVASPFADAGIAAYGERPIFPKFSAKRRSALKVRVLARAAGATVATACRRRAVNCVCPMKSAVCAMMNVCC